MSHGGMPVMPTVPHRASVRLTDEIDTQLRRQGRRARAEGEKAYLKSELTFRATGVPVVR